MKIPLLCKNGVPVANIELGLQWVQSSNSHMHMHVYMHMHIDIHMCVC